MYALKIRKSDLPLINLLSGDAKALIADDIKKMKPSRLIVWFDSLDRPTTTIVTEKEFDTNYADKVSTSGPSLLKINKR